MHNLRSELEETLSTALRHITGIETASAMVASATRPEFGDYQANGIMPLAKQLKRNPRELAADLVAALPNLSLVERIEVAGPGFVNILLSPDALAVELTKEAIQGEISVDLLSSPERIVIDYSSPNLAKEMHVGHLRGTIIGDALVRILSFQGHTIIRQNHVGDWGTQFGMLIAHMEDLGHEDLNAPLADLEKFYRDAKARFDEEPEFAERARLKVVDLQGGNQQTRESWQAFIGESMSHCEAVYERLGVLLQPSDLCPESFYNDALPGIVDHLKARQMLQRSDGADCVFLPEFIGKDGAPLPVIVRKSDGGYLYATTDLAALEYRCQKLKADKILYVVDARQSLHFQQVFAVARQAQLVSDSCQPIHISYGTMMGSDGRPFKTRTGGTVKLAELLDEAVHRAYEIVSIKNPDMEQAMRATIARVVGIGAVKYADLSKHRNNDYVFDWDAMLSFDGNTAPYLLYAYARIRSILRKSEVNFTDCPILIKEPAERELALSLCRFPEAISRVSEEFAPNHLCVYLYGLSTLFMKFYEACQILKADNAETKQSRLQLAQITARTIRRGLSLLGIEVLEQM